ncbi:DNA repair helicase (rad3) family protein [Babesia divergens]|uniref:DNA repair helicase (Rad3) family protein n=1 Tax=Babesia divergens TaxID=32595 RepID=A0AAD9LDN6_BABDI|nr:DNA repair helicase (rad3) family protein [Babesia divergens]
MANQTDTINIIDGVEVRFPYTPYQCQTVYMESVIKTVKGGHNALLESPTGTGKTLSLICSTLACLWHARFKDENTFKPRTEGTLSEASLLSTISHLRNTVHVSAKLAKERKAPKLKIIYASRTHSQLKQVIREAKKSSYTNEFAAKGLTAVVLGSRDQLCIHGGRGNATGGTKIEFYEFMDIEDLVLVGKSKRCCPFYASRDAHEDADVTLLPYNYLLSPMSRDAVDIKLNNAILIIDEAHNVESVAESAAGFAIRQVDIARYLIALRRFAAAHKKAMDSQDADSSVKLDVAPLDFSSLAKLAMTLKKMDSFLTNLTFNKEGQGVKMNLQDIPSWHIDNIKRDHMVFKGADMLSFLMRTLGLGELRNMKIDEVIKSCIANLSTNIDDLAYAYQAHYDSNKDIQDDIQSLTSLLLFFQHMFSKELQACPEYFHAFLTNDARFSTHQMQEPENASAGNPTGKTGWKSKSAFNDNNKNVQCDGNTRERPLPKVLAFECLQSTPSFLRLMNEGVRSMILTSGTLSPLSDLEKSIGGTKLTFQYKLSNTHVIPPSHVCALTITGTDAASGILSSDFNTRFTPTYLKALGETLITFLASVPAGVLVFFGSYNVMEQTINHWKKMGLYARMEREKQIFVETNSSSTLMADAVESKNVVSYTMDVTQTQLKEYNSLVTKGKGCAFIGVCRGKIAEGIDFSDDACRGVFVCGVPYPNPYEDNVALKMDYIRKSGGSSSAKDAVSQWYTSQGIRAVNQAIGRSIRHINDYGAIVLADRRFTATKLQQGISQWVSRNLKTKDSIKECLKEFREFFERFGEKKAVNTAPFVKSSTRIISRFFSPITDSVSQPGPDQNGAAAMSFKYRKLGNALDHRVASSLRSGAPVKSFSNGFRSRPDSSISTAPSSQNTESTQSGWDVIDSWSNQNDAISLTNFKKK